MAPAQSERMRVAVQVKVEGEAGMNKSVTPEQHGVHGALHGLVLPVWVQRFRWWGGGTSGQRDGQGHIPEDHAGMPKNWNLKLWVKGSHCSFQAGQERSQIYGLDTSFRQPGEGLGPRSSR